MKKLVSIPAALLLLAAVLPGLAAAVDLSANLDGDSPRQEGFASVVAEGNSLRFTVLTNGIGTPTRAVIRRGGTDVVELGGTFNFGTVNGVATSGEVTAILASPASYVLQVEGPDGTVAGPLAGVAAEPGIKVDPLRRNFGNVAVGTVAAPRPVTVSNDGDRSYRITLVGIFGVNRGQYSLVDDGCSGVNLAPGASCTVTFRFEPSAAGTQRALLVVRSNDPANGEYRVQLRGEGI